MSLFIEIYRTALPDYPNCSTGTEAKTKGRSASTTVIEDFYINKDFAINFFIDKFYTQVKNFNPLTIENK